MKNLCKQLGLKEGQLIRTCLEKWASLIDVEKQIGAPVGNQNNPTGNPETNKHYQE